MKVFIYMSHRIRQKRPRKPVIICQTENGLVQEGNTITINGPSVVRYDPRGMPIESDHDVKAWIEALARDVVVS